MTFQNHSKEKIRAQMGIYGHQSVLPRMDGGVGGWVGWVPWGMVTNGWSFFSLEWKSHQPFVTSPPTALH